MILLITLLVHIICDKIKNYVNLITERKEREKERERENDFAEISKNLTRYRFENFVELSK